ncbi:MAG TPA: glycoside hydrolase family 15 protein [Streptosporangiaceae bacterium]|nr:glycoside hydrolase family 15 protein [Streptosporangiaceae bacterium]
MRKVITMTAQQVGQAGQNDGQGRQIQYARVQVGLPQASLTAIAQHMFCLMMRNMSSDGFVFADPLASNPFAPGTFSAPGCIIAAPSFPADLGTVDQDYVFNFTRDSAITAVEIAAASMPTRPGDSVQSLIDYVNFARLCQKNSGSVTIGHSAYTVEGQPQPRSEQSDGPALQTLAILQAFPQLDAPTQAMAASVIATNLDYLLGTDPATGVPVFQSKTTNLWEEEYAFSFFARAVQLKCFQQVMANTVGIPVPAGTAAAVSWLQNALQGHWTGQFYRSLIPAPADNRAPYDPNIDIVLSSLYGAVPLTDTKMLATAALIRRQWSDPASTLAYPINEADLARTPPVGPMLGRYPGDTYDGDLHDPAVTGHPWALCTANFACLYYGLANIITQGHTVPLDSLSADFFGQVGITASSTPDQAASNLRTAADQMLQALVFHSDRLELSEQFDKDSGFEKSVRDLTWSYASFLAAVRAKTGQSVLG